MSKRQAVLWSAVAVAASIVVFMASSARAAHEVVLRGGQFVPQEQYVGEGDTVIWIHDDGGTAHSVTADDGSFDSNPACAPNTQDQCLKAGQSFSHQFIKTGRYPYFSKLHGGPGGQGMSGVIIVVEKGTGPSSSTTR